MRNCVQNDMKNLPFPDLLLEPHFPVFFSVQHAVFELQDEPQRFLKFCQNRTHFGLRPHVPPGRFLGGPRSPPQPPEGSRDPSQDGSKSLPRHPKGPQMASRKMGIHPMNDHRTCTQCVRIRSFVFKRFWASGLKGAIFQPRTLLPKVCRDQARKC